MRIISTFRRRAARATLGALVTASAPVVPLAGLSQSRPVGTNGLAPRTRLGFLRLALEFYG